METGEDPGRVIKIISVTSGTYHSNFKTISDCKYSAFTNVCYYLTVTVICIMSSHVFQVVRTSSKVQLQISIPCLAIPYNLHRMLCKSRVTAEEIRLCLPITCHRVHEDRPKILGLVCKSRFMRRSS